MSGGATADLMQYAFRTRSESLCSTLPWGQVPIEKILLHLCLGISLGIFLECYKMFLLLMTPLSYNCTPTLGYPLAVTCGQSLLAIIV